MRYFSLLVLFSFLCFFSKGHEPILDNIVQEALNKQILTNAEHEAQDIKSKDKNPLKERIEDEENCEEGEEIIDPELEAYIRKYF